mmetsp:Transcript_39160/g.94074  ORF Transcript_39160/g.94074 Transcript_39160/m.94074 type:complete len:954 (-) Transcript_39160:12-2873(-)
MGDTPDTECSPPEIQRANTFHRRQTALKRIRESMGRPSISEALDAQPPRVDKFGRRFHPPPPAWSASVVARSWWWLAEHIRAGHRWRRDLSQGSPECSHPFPALFDFMCAGWFDACVALMIMANTVSLGIEANAGVDAALPTWLEIGKHVMLTFFVVEYVLNAVTFRISWCLEWYNIFDAFLIWGTGIVVTWVMPLLNLRGSPVLRNLQVLRALRLARVLRTLRTIYFFRDLTTIVAGVLDSMRTMVWSLVVLFGVLLLFSTACVDLIGRDVLADGIHDDLSRRVYRMYGTFPEALFTLYQVFTMDGWGMVVQDTVDRSGPVTATIIFLPFMGIGCLVVANLILAVVTDQAFSSARNDERAKALEMQRKADVMFKSLREMFLSVDEDGSGDIDFQELLSAFRDNAKVRILFAALDIEEDEIEEVWNLFDDGDGTLSITEFVKGLRKIKGKARPVDAIQAVRKAKQLCGVTESLDVKLGAVSRELTSFSSGSECLLDASTEVYNILSSLSLSILGEELPLGARTRTATAAEKSTVDAAAAESVARSIVHTQQTSYEAASLDIHVETDPGLRHSSQIHVENWQPPPPPSVSAPPPPEPDIKPLLVDGATFTAGHVPVDDEPKAPGMGKSAEHSPSSRPTTAPRRPASGSRPSTAASQPVGEDLSVGRRGPSRERTKGDQSRRVTRRPASAAGRPVSARPRCRRAASAAAGKTAVARGENVTAAPVLWPGAPAECRAAPAQPVAGHDVQDDPAPTNGLSHSPAGSRTRQRSAARRGETIAIAEKGVQCDSQEVPQPSPEPLSLSEAELSLLRSLLARHAAGDGIRASRLPHLSQAAPLHGSQPIDDSSFWHHNARHTVDASQPSMWLPPGFMPSHGGAHLARDARDSSAWYPAPAQGECPDGHVVDVGFAPDDEALQAIQAQNEHLEAQLLLLQRELSVAGVEVAAPASSYGVRWW